MKDMYMNPEVEVVEFSAEDVITTSTETTRKTCGGKVHATELPEIEL